MYREFFMRSPMLTFPLVALMIFLAVFAVILVRTWWRRPSTFDAASRLPLLDDEVRHG